MTTVAPDSHGLADSSPAAGYALKPAARVLWRSDQTLQFELGDRAVVVDGFDSSVVASLLRRGQSTDVSALSTGGVQRTLGLLCQAGFLWQPPAPDDSRFIPGPRLAPDVEALRARHGPRAEQVLATRRGAVVAVHGTARAAAQVAAVLAAAGVGHVYAADSGDVRIHQAAPGGLLTADEGRRFSTAAQNAIHRAAPDTNAGPVPPGRGADLVVLLVEGPVDEGASQTLHASHSPHLVTRMWADQGVVGPLVIPGRSSCLRCADLHRLDRDPAWTALAVQLATPPRHAPPADVVVTTIMAGYTALQALAYLADEPAASVNGTLELQLPDYRIRRRTWRPHPDCECGAHGADVNDSAESTP